MNSNSLRKSLSLADVFCIAAGAMVSAGIFLLPGTAFAHVGPAVVFSYLLGGILAGLGILAVLELATAMPQAGGIYYFTTRSLGPLPGTLSGVLNGSALALKSAFAIWGTAQIAHGWLVSVPAPVIGIVLTVLFLALNLLGTSAAARMQCVLVFALLGIMLAYIVLGAPKMDMVRFSPWLGEGVSPARVISEAGFLFVSFGGLLGVVSVAEEVREPRRNIPRGILLGLFVVTVFYVLVMAVTVGAVAPETLAHSFEPLADAAREYFGPTGGAVLTAGALLAFVTTANAGLLGAARYPVALARDHYAPAVFARTMGRAAIPVPALLFTGVVVGAVQFLDIERLVSVASTVVMLSYVLANLSVVILRESGVLNYRPTFRVPFYPVLPLACMAAFIWMVVKLGDTSIGLTFALIAASVLLYARYGLREKRDSALRKLLVGLVRPDFAAPGLERELREAVRSRDGLVEDAFDRAVEAAPTFLVPGSMTLAEFFREAARLASPTLGIDPEALTSQVLAREELSSTVIAPGVAVPHLAVEGTSGHFLIVIAKSEDGVNFASAESAADGDAPAPVRTAVFLFASPDCRAMHLRSLAKVAQCILSSGFEERWRKARTPQQLRDIFLLAKRTRAD